MFISKEELEKLIEKVLNDHLGYLRSSIKEDADYIDEIGSRVDKLEDYLGIEQGYVKNKKK